MRGSESYTLVQLTSTVAMSIHDVELLPPLYSPQLVALGNDALLLRGFEAETARRTCRSGTCCLLRSIRALKILPEASPQHRRRRHDVNGILGV